MNKNALDYIEKHKQLEVDGWIFRHKLLRCQSGEVVSLRAPTNQRLFEDRFEISVFWHPKNVVRNENLESIDPEEIGEHQDRSHYNGLYHAKEKCFGVVVRDMVSGETMAISEGGESLGVSFIGDFAQNRSKLPELMNDKFEEGFEGSELECVAEVIKGLSFYSPQYITDPRPLDAGMLQAILHAKDRGINTGAWDLGDQKKNNTRHSFSF